MSEWESHDLSIFTQRMFLASPRGTWLAVADPASGALGVRGRRGVVHTITNVMERDARFSPDERFLAALRSDDPAGVQVALLDLTSGALRTLATLHSPRWIEWVAGGVVVSHGDPDRGGQALSFLPLDGEPRRLVSSATLLDRFTAARRGSRVLYVDDGRAFLIDAAGGGPVELGPVPGTLLDNLELAPDGGQAALATTTGLHLWTAGAGFTRLDDDSAVHSVWYSPSGDRLAWASASGARVRSADGAIRRLPAPHSDLHALRFQQGGDGLLVSMGRRALLWRPGAGAPRVLGRAPAGQTMQGAEQFRGGTLLWTREIRLHKGRSMPRFDERQQAAQQLRR